MHARGESRGKIQVGGVSCARSSSASERTMVTSVAGGELAGGAREGGGVRGDCVYRDHGKAIISRG